MAGRWLLVGVVLGCHGGGGPVVAFSNGHIRVGAEAGGGYGPVGASAGATTAVASGRNTRWYTGLDAAVAAELPGAGEDAYVGIGATLGYTSGDPAGSHALVGVWGAPFAITTHNCDNTGAAYSIAVGLRVVGGITELFASPKVSAVFAPCRDDHSLQ